jgi:glycosyltransferase involved in cell wall biosynthesis
VRFLGVRQDVPNLLAISDLFVLPSLWEGLPNSVLEAMAAGLPVVATNVDGSPEVVVDGETGVLVPPADPVALADAICSLLQDEALRVSMAEAARTRVAECFSQEANVAAFEDLYQGLIGQGVSA